MLYFQRTAYCFAVSFCFVATLCSAEPKPQAKQPDKVDEKAIRAELEKRDCEVMTIGLKPNEPIFSVRFRHEKFTSGDVANALPLLKQISGLREVFLPYKATDDDFKALAELKDLKNLKEVGAVSSKVTNAGLLELKTLPNLKSINVIGAKNVTPEGIRQAFEAIPSLEVVLLGTDDNKRYTRESK